MQNKSENLTLSTLPCGACRIQNDAFLTILEANDEYYRMYGYTQEEAEKSGFTSISFITYPPDWQISKQAAQNKIKDDIKTFEIETRCVHRTGEIIWVMVRCAVDPSDSLCLNCVVMDVTESKNKLERLKAIDEERKLLLKLSDRCVFRYDLSTRRLTIPPETAAELKLPESIDNVPYSMVNDGYVLPESAEDFVDFYEAMLRGEKSGETVIHTADKERRDAWCRSVFSLVTDRDGTPKYTVISLEDISEQREKQLAYEKWTQYNKTQLEDATIFYECNITKNRIDQIGGPLAKDLPEDVRTCYDDTFRYILKNLIYPEDLLLYRDFFNRAGMRACFHDGKRELILEYRRFGCDNKPFWAQATVQLLADPFSEDIKAFFIIKNIDFAKRKELELKMLSQSDALTGLLNRRTVIEQISSLFQSSGPQGRHAFIMVDIDKFKSFNDTKGHQFGDRILIELAQTLKSALRAEDIVGRIGGDEFVICLKNMPLNNVLEEKLTLLCSLLSKRVDEQMYISSSLGVAVFPKDGITFDELYLKADMALYEAKKLGRNRVVFYQEGMDKNGWRPCRATPIDTEEPDFAASVSSKEWHAVRDSVTGQVCEGLLEQYIKSSQRMFDDLLVLNVSDNTFYLPYLTSHKEDIPRQGCLTDMIKNSAGNMIHKDDAVRFVDFLDWDTVREKFNSGNKSINEELRKLNSGGYYRWSELTLVPMETDNGKEIYLCFVRDIEDRVSVQNAQTQSRVLLGRQMEDECYRTIMEQAGMIILEYERETGSYYASAQARQFVFIKNTGASENHYFLTQEDVHPDDWQKTKSISTMISAGKASASEVVRLKKTDGTFLWCSLTLTVLRDENGVIVRSLITVNDVDEATKNRRELEYRAEYDTLTGHFNFSKFKIDAARWLKNREGRKYSLWYCDLRNFKLINDMYGYDFGDKVLCYWANVGAGSLQEGEVFARISGDHFASLHWYNDRSELDECFARMSQMLSDYGKKQGKKLRLELVSGVYCIEKEEDLLSIEDMIDRANIAQKSVKRLDGSRIAYYTNEMRRQLLRDKEVEAIMVKALEDGEFRPYFQPMADIQHDGAVTGAEALARWVRPGEGVVSPGEFIPLFEKNGFIAELDRYMFEEACKYLRKLIDQGKKPIKLSVNVSRISVFRKDFARCYTQIKEHYDIPDGLLELECTETTMVENAELLETVMRKMRISGFCFSMDDFGSGYSSLNLLKDVTVEVLKLDMMFFRNNKLFEPRNQTIITSIVGMAKALNMKVVAEGVETAEQMEVLKALGCDYIQGYYISRPIPVAEFEQRYIWKT